MASAEYHGINTPDPSLPEYVENPPMPSKLKFLPNIPITLELLNPEGDYDFDLQMGQYQTVDGRSLILPRQAVIALNLLEPLPGEEIGICYRISKGEPAKWDIWLTPK